MNKNSTFEAWISEKKQNISGEMANKVNKELKNEVNKESKNEVNKVCDIENKNSTSSFKISEMDIDKARKKAVKGSISLCIIAKNEESNIARCIGSCEHIADEIIVVDTGSTDNTVKIAKSLGAKVIIDPWDNNFSKARNKAVDEATMEWILYLDCDEMLDFDDGYTLKETLESDAVVEGASEGFCLNLINVVDNKMTLNYGSLRVFRNKPTYRFRGRIHEQIFPSIGEKYPESVIQGLQVNFYHYGYDDKLNDIEAKKARNIKIFESYEESEKDGFFYYNLGNEYTRAGDAKKALENYLLSRKTPAYDNGFKLFLPIYICKCYYDIKKYKEAIEVGLEYLKPYPNYKDLNFIVAVCYYELSMFKECKEYMERYIEYSKENYGYPEFYLDKCNNLEDIMKEVNAKIGF